MLTQNIYLRWLFPKAISGALRPKQELVTSTRAYQRQPFPWWRIHVRNFRPLYKAVSINMERGHVPFHAQLLKFHSAHLVSSYLKHATLLGLCESTNVTYRSFLDSTPQYLFLLQHFAPRCLSPLNVLPSRRRQQFFRNVYLQTCEEMNIRD
jgi:hypothetical protein